MKVQEKLYTVEEYLEITRLPENENKRLELIDGVIQEKMPPSDRINTVIAGLIIYYLNAYVISRKTGYVSVPDGSYELGEGKVRLPDAAFISTERAQGLEGNTFAVAPDLAVEVISDSETATKVRKKVRDYLDAGTKIVWTVYPADKLVEIHRLNENGTLLTDTYREGDILNGGNVLPEFSLAVKAIFPE